MTKLSKKEQREFFWGLYSGKKPEVQKTTEEDVDKNKVLDEILLKFDENKAQQGTPSPLPKSSKPTQTKTVAQPVNETVQKQHQEVETTQLSYEEPSENKYQKTQQSAQTQYQPAQAEVAPQPTQFYTLSKKETKKSEQEKLEKEKIKKKLKKNKEQTEKKQKKNKEKPEKKQKKNKEKPEKKQRKNREKSRPTKKAKDKKRRVREKVQYSNQDLSEDASIFLDADKKERKQIKKNLETVVKSEAKKATIDKSFLERLTHKRKAVKQFRKQFAKEQDHVLWNQGRYGKLGISKLRKFAKKTALTGALLGLLGGAGFTTWFKEYYYPKQIVEATNWKYKDIEVIKKEILPEDSYAFGKNGITKLGAMMKRGNGNVHHRSYLEFKNIPPEFFHALTSAEDKRFGKDGACNSLGPDFCGMSYAAIKGALKKMQGYKGNFPGGSNIYMQTADNLFGLLLQREEYRGNTFEEKVIAKIPEIRDAMRLKKHFTPEQVFELYANAFYVSGTTHGYAGAMKYYFDVGLEDILTHEDAETTTDDIIRNAFIAGSVKSPGFYNPFVVLGARGERTSQERTQAQRKRNIERAIDRIKYVTRRMVEDGRITSEQHKEVLDKLNDESVPLKQRIPFKHGNQPFKRDNIIDKVYVENREYFKNNENCKNTVFSGVDDPNFIYGTGTRIITTINPEIQDIAFYSLRQALTKWTVQLDSYSSPGLTTKIKGTDGKIIEEKLSPSKVTTPKVHEFYTARVKEIHTDGKNSRLNIELGGVEGIIDFEALKRIAWFQKQHDLAGEWVKPRNVKKKDVEKLLRKIKKDKKLGNDLIYCSYNGEKDGAQHFDLEQTPHLEAQLMFLDAKTGNIISMVGSNDNKGLNYLESKTGYFIGSMGKPLFHASASLLKWPLWGPKAKLPAIAALFGTLDGEGYAPKNDSDPNQTWDSPIRAVSKSRNASNVNLLHHMFDYLNDSELEKYLRGEGFLQQEGESYEEYLKRPITKMMVCQTKACNSPKLEGRNIRQAIRFSELFKKHTAFNMWKKEAQNSGLKGTSKLEKNFATQDMFFRLPSNVLEKLKKKRAETISEDKQEEIDYKIQAFQFNYEDLNAKLPDLENKIAQIRSAIQVRDYTALSSATDSLSIIRNGIKKALALCEDDFCPSSTRTADYLMNLDAESLETTLSDENIFIAKGHTRRRASISTIKEIDQGIQKYLATLNAVNRKDLYKFEFLRYHPEFITLAAEQHYITHLKNLGVNTSKFIPQPSIVLGTIPTNLYNMAIAYASQYSGNVVKPKIIQSYENRLGEKLCSINAKFKKAKITEQSRHHIAQLQRLVATMGTAASLNYRTKVTIPVGTGKKDLRVWVGGKTGTANDYEFAAFAGIFPNLLGEYESLPPEQQQEGLTSASLDHMIIGVVRVHPEKVLRRQYAKNWKKMRHGGVSMVGSDPAKEIFLPITKAILQQQVDNKHAQGKDLIDPRVVEKGLNILDIKRPSYETERKFVYLGNRDYFDQKEVDVDECRPIVKNCSFDYTKTDGSSYSIPCEYRPEYCKMNDGSKRRIVSLDMPVTYESQLDLASNKSADTAQSIPQQPQQETQLQTVTSVDTPEIKPKPHKLE